jgi:hypothetical protein
VLSQAVLLRQAQDRLLQQITGGSNVSSIRKTCWDWYLTYLDARITEIWPTFAARAFQGAGPDANMVSIKARADFYDILIRITRFIEERSTDDDTNGNGYQRIDTSCASSLVSSMSQPSSVQYGKERAESDDQNCDEKPQIETKTFGPVEKIPHRCKSRARVRRKSSLPENSWTPEVVVGVDFGMTCTGT